jgi:hypothetical protein
VGMQGLNFGLPALLIGLSSTLVGGCFLLAAFSDVRSRGATRDIPAAFYTMLVAVVLDFVLPRCLWSGPGEMLYELCKLIFATNIGFLIATLVLARKIAVPGINSIRKGSRILLVIAALGLALIIWANAG